MIEQIRDVLISIENSSSKTEKINYAFEVCKLVFENTKLDEMQYKDLEAEDMISDFVLLLDDIVKSISQILSNSLLYIDKEVIVEDYELEIRENIQKLENLQIKYTSSTKQYQELKKAQKEIKELQLKIDEYGQIDLEVVQKEREEKLIELAELERTEEDNLKRYKMHLEENKKLNIFNAELLELSTKIDEDLKKMDSIYSFLLKKS